MRRTSAAVVAAAIAATVAVSVVTAAAVPAAAQTTLPKPSACDSEVITEDGMLDVLDGNVHEAAIDCAVSWGLAQGTGPSTYSPATSVTRGQMASFMARLVDKSAGSLPAGSPDAFTDDAGNPHEANINALAAAAVVAGTSKGSYSPMAAVNRGQMASFLVRTYEHRIGRSLPAGPDAFSDDDGSVHEVNVDKAVAAGFARGLTDGRYAAEASVRRDQMGSFLTRVLEQIVADTTVTGTCAPVTIAAQDTGTVPVTLPEGRGNVVDAAAAVALEGEVGDAVISLDNTVKDVALLVGREGPASGGSLLFRDGARQQAAARQVDEQGRVGGTVSPVEPLTELRGEYVLGAWSLLVLNAGDQPLRLNGCSVSLRLADAVMPLGAVAPAAFSADPEGAGPVVLIAWLVFAGTPMLLVLMRPRSARRAVASLACLGVMSTFLIAGGSATPAQAAVARSPAAAQAAVARSPAAAQAAVAPIPGHSWGSVPDGRVIVASGDVPAEYNDGTARSGGLFSVPVTCSELSCHTRLTASPTDREPAVSPSGQQVVFVRTVESVDHLMVLDMRTGQARSLMQFPRVTVANEFYPVQEAHPTWSPDEQRIAASTGWHIFTISARGGPASFVDEYIGDPLLCTEYPEETKFQRRSPSWSPDGTRLIYTRSEFGTDLCLADQARHLFSAPVGDFSSETRLGALEGVRSIDHSPDGQSMVVVATGNSYGGGNCESACPPMHVDAATGAVLSTMNQDFGSFGAAARPRWAPAGTHLLSAGGLVQPDGSLWQDPYDCREDSAFPDKLVLSCYGSQVGVGVDLQCSPGNCLSGIALRVTKPSSTGFSGALRASGALTGTVTGEYLFAKRLPGDHAVQVTGDLATVQGITCDDNDSTVSGGAITYRVQESEIITCTVDLGLLNDRDGDDISDDIDACPDDPLNECILDRDGDGIPNSDDPCPDDATNTCTPPPPSPTQVCKPFEVDVAGDTGGLEWFQFNTYGRVCSSDPAGKQPLLTPQQSGDVTLQPTVAAILSTVFSVQYDPDSNASQPVWSGLDTVALTGSFDLCALPLPGVGKLGGAFNKLVAKVHRWGFGRLISKVTSMWLDGFLQIARATAGQLDMRSAAQVNSVIDYIHETVGAGIEQAMTSGILGASICVPMWEPTVTLTASPSGKLVNYVVTDQGIPTPRLLTATNAVG